MSLTPEQIEIRRKGIGGSEIGAVLGLSRFGSPLSVWLDKKGLRSFEGNAMTEWGERMEPVALAWYAERVGEAFERTPMTFAHPSAPAVATPDAFASNGPGERAHALVEVKCPRFLDGEWGPDGSSRVPHGYALQIQWTDMVLRATGLDFARLRIVAMAPGDLRIYEIPRDLELQAMLLKEATAWWERHIIADVAPPLDGSEVASDWLRQRFPKVEKKELRKATPRESLLLDALQIAESEKAVAEHDYALARQLVEEAIGGSEGIESDIGRVTWKSTTRGRTFKTKWNNQGEGDE